MLTRFSDYLICTASGRILIILFVVFILTTSVILPLVSSLIEDPAGELESIDTKLYYSPAEIY